MVVDEGGGDDAGLDHGVREEIRQKRNVDLKPADAAVLQDTVNTREGFVEDGSADGVLDEHGVVVGCDGHTIYSTGGGPSDPGLARRGGRGRRRVRRRPRRHRRSGTTTRGRRRRRTNRSRQPGRPGTGRRPPLYGTSCHVSLGQNKLFKNKTQKRISFSKIYNISCH